MPDLQFYQTPIILDTNEHRNLRLKVPFPNLLFTAQASSIPLICAEFSEACKTYPIVFLKAADNSVFPVAVTGLESNFFLTPEGSWDAPYIPAFVRRYPFAPAAPTEDGRFSICIDAGCPGFNDPDGERLFNDDATPTAFMSGVLDFMGQFHHGMMASDGFCKLLMQEGLLRDMTSELATVNGTRRTLNGFLGIDGEKFAEISAEFLLQLRDKGFLPFIYQHFVSLSNFTGIANRLARREAAEPSAA